jgi:medium-chain acyl-[acyl-carrier-protein] hydrolase
MSDHAWFVRRPGPFRPFRLYCFAYAGGNASFFMGWQDRLPPDVEVCGVQLPGRGARFGEAPFREMTCLVDALAPVLQRSIDRPFALLGHSLGALVAFEVARRLAARGAERPRHLYVSGCHAPQFRDPPKDYHLLDDDKLVEVLRDYNGTPPEVLADRQLVSMLLPSIRADFAIAETYRYQPSVQLDVPLTAWAGREEVRSSPEQVSGWAMESTGAFEQAWFDGGHFFIHQQRQQVLEELASASWSPSPR